MARQSLFYIIGYRIGYWIAGHRDALMRNAAGAVLGRLPGGRWLMRMLR